MVQNKTNISGLYLSCDALSSLLSLKVQIKGKVKIKYDKNVQDALMVFETPTLYLSF